MILGEAIGNTVIDYATHLVQHQAIANLAESLVAVQHGVEAIEEPAGIPTTHRHLARRRHVEHSDTFSYRRHFRGYGFPHRLGSAEICRSPPSADEHHLRTGIKQILMQRRVAERVTGRSGEQSQLFGTKRRARRGYADLCNASPSGSGDDTRSRKG